LYYENEELSVFVIKVRTQDGNIDMQRPPKPPQKDPHSDQSPDVQWKVFGLSFSISAIFLIFVILLIPIGTVAGVGVSGVGGFQAYIEELNGQDVSLYPTTGETAGCIDTTNYNINNDPTSSDDSFSMIQAEIGQAELAANSELRFIKDIKTPEIAGIDGMRILLTNEGGSSQSISIGDLVLDASSLRGEELVLQGDVLLDDRNFVDQFADRADSRRANYGEFVLTGNDATLKDTTANVHFVAFDVLQVPGLVFDVDYLDENSNVGKFSADGNKWDSLPAEGLEGFGHAGDYVHDNNPIREGETRRYRYQALESGADIRFHLRDDVYEADGSIGNEINEFGSRYTTSTNESVSVLVDYTNPSQVEINVNNGALTQTYDASADDEVYYSSYEYLGEFSPSKNSLRLLTGDGYSPDGSLLFDPEGYSHDNDWVHHNFPIKEGEVRTYTYQDFGPTGQIRAGLRDGFYTADGSFTPSNLVYDSNDAGEKYALDGNEQRVEVEVDYTDPNQVVIDFNNGDQVNTYDASGDGPLFWSSYEFSGTTGQESLRLLTESDDAFGGEFLKSTVSDDCGVSGDARLDAYLVDYSNFAANDGTGTVTAEVDATNPGVNNAVTETLTLEVDGTTEDTATVTVSPDDTVTRTLTWNVPSGQTTGAYDVQVTSSNGEDTVTESTFVFSP
jgi:hypothetical protein